MMVLFIIGVSVYATRPNIALLYLTGFKMFILAAMLNFTLWYIFAFENMEDLMISLLPMAYSK